MENCIELRGVTKLYTDFHLDIDSVDIPKGKITGLVGKNGAGKSTLIDLIVGLRSPVSGSISVLGSKNLRDRALKERIGFVVENTAFHDRLTPSDIDRVYRRIYKQWDSSSFYDLLEQFGVNLRGRFADYSKGTKTKILLTTALAHKPDLVILDEPTSGLDPVVRCEVLDIVRQAAKKGGCTILFSTHIVSDLSESADEILVLKSGSVAFHGPICMLASENTKGLESEGTASGASSIDKAVVSLMTDTKEWGRNDRATY